jgi:hypothetical protein
MTRDSPFHGSITTEEEFSETLSELVLKAHTNGVDVVGSWECPPDGHDPDWEALVTELSKASRGGE